MILNNKNIKVLMIDKDLSFSTYLSNSLKPYRVEITPCLDPYFMFNKISEFDLIIVDYKLSAITLSKEISKKYNLPIIVSDSKDQIENKIEALESGAHYYLPKPYKYKEFYAIIHSLLRRLNKNHNKKVPTFKLNSSKSQILFKNKELQLTLAEYKIMHSLLKNKNLIVSREQLIYDSTSINNPHGKSLDVIISRLRKKLGDNSKKTKYIHAIRGLGYRINQ